MPPLLVLDRLEALFQSGAEAQAAAVIGWVDTLVRSRLAMVLAICRNDFYARLADHTVLMQDKEHGSHMDLVTAGCRRHRADHPAACARGETGLWHRRQRPVPAGRSPVRRSGCRPATPCPCCNTRSRRCT
jgi:hypothetical protein